MTAATADFFNPLRYWTDRPVFMASFDAVDAELDREDSLSERHAFLLGCDLGHRRLQPPQDSEGKERWPHPELERGYAHGLQLPAHRGDVYLRKLLGLQVRAFARGIPVSSALTVDYLRNIMVSVCPVSGVNLTQGALADTDWSIDRLDNSLGYVPGNVCMMSSRVNTLKGDATFKELTTELQSILVRYGPDASTAELSCGLGVIEGFRLASLMAAPSGFAKGGLATYAPFAMAPGAWATLDAVVASIHVECARTRIEGSAYARRKVHFKRLGSKSWRDSNRLVEAIRTELARGTHPADIWFDGALLALLQDLMESLLANPPQLDQIDPAVLAQTMRSDIQPLRQYVR